MPQLHDNASQRNSGNDPDHGQIHIEEPRKAAKPNTAIGDHRVEVMVYDGHNAQVVHSEWITLPDLCSKILNEQQLAEAIPPFISFEHYDKSMPVIFGIIVECCYTERTTFQKLSEALTQANIRALIWTAPITYDDPDCYILVPFSERLLKEKRWDMSARLNGVLKGAVTAESFDIETAFPFGKAADHPDQRVANDHRAIVIDGAFIDKRLDLDAGAIEPPETNILGAVDLWSTFDPPELPTGLLPKVIEKFARIEGDNMGCDPAGLAMAGLTVCAAAIPDFIRLQVKEHDLVWTEPARVWAALVGDPSTKKSPILKHAVTPLAAIDNRLVADYLTEKEEYETKSAEEKKLIPTPRCSRVKIEDTTVEAAQEVLKDSPDGVLCHQDELSGFFGIMDKYSGKGGGADRAFWMKAYNGGSYSYHRIARGSANIRNLSVSLLGGIQPDAIRKVAGDSIDDGLLQRMLFIVLRAAKVDQDKPRDPVVKAYNILVTKLYNLQPPGQTSFSEKDPDDDTVLRFDPAAKVIRNQLAQTHIDMMNTEAVNKKLATHIGKYDGVFARLCVLWHCIENVDRSLPVLVTEDTARRVAIFLHEFIFKHAAAFYFDILGLANDHDRMKNVASFILAKRLTTVNNRDVQRGDRSMRKLTDFDTQKIFEQLEALGWLYREQKPLAKKITWQVNPMVHEQFKERAKTESKRRTAARKAVKDVFKKGDQK